MIARSDIDAFIIASPDSTHAALAIACIQAGKPALCEKPLAPTSADCQTIMEAEIAAGRQLIQVGFMRRYDQSYTEMKAALAEGRIGKPLMMHNFHRNVDNPAEDFTGAMAITNSAPHEFDITRFVLGTEPVAITAFQPQRSDALVAPVFMVLETAEGQLVNIEINNNAAYGYDVRGELVGEQGSVSLARPNYSLLDKGLAQVSDYPGDWRPRYAEAYRRQNKSFLKFVQTGEFPEIGASCWDGYAASVIGETGVRALDTGSRTEIEMIARPSFYG